MPKKFEIFTAFMAVDKTSRVVGKIQSKVMKFTSKVSTGMRKVNRAVSRVSSAVTSGLKYGFSVAAAAATGLFLAINKTAGSMDALAKKARTIDFPIEEFQEWRFVAEQSGVSADVFEKSMQKFARVIGDAKNKTGSLYTVLKKNDRGLLRQVRGTRDTAEAFDLMVAAIREVKDPTEKASLAAATFGRAGVDMVNMINLEADEIKKLREEMRANGLVTEEQARKAEKYNDMMNSTSKVVAAFMFDVLTPLMPIMTEVMEIARKWAVENRGIVSSKLKSGLSWLIKNFGKIIEYGKKIAIGIGVFYGIATAVKAVNIAMTVFNTLAAMNPIGLIIIATVAACAAIYVFRKDLIRFTVDIIEKFKAAGAKIKDVFTNPKKYIIQAWEYIKDAVPRLWESMWSKIKKVASFAIDNLKDYVGIFVDLFTGDWDGACEHFTRLWDRMKGAAMSVLESIRVVLDPILKGIGIALDWDRSGEKTKVGGVAGNLGGAATSIAASVVPQTIRPSVSLSRTEMSTSNRDEVEVTIKDDTKRASVTKGSSRRLKLVHTGAMP